MTESAESTALRQTPLHSCHRAADGRLVPFAGYELPVRYTSQVEEHHAVRQAAGLFDVSHMGEIRISGPEAVALVQRLTPNDVATLEPGRAHYSALLDESGCYLDDLLVYRLGGEELLLVVNAAHRQQDLEWVRRHAQGLDVAVVDESDDTALLALQGPRSAAILARLTDLELPSLGYYCFEHGEVEGRRTLISRTGYTGEDGFELYVAADDAVRIWRALLAAGAEDGLRPAGLGARDTLRLEAGMLLSGQDIGPGVTPLEAGLGWTVKLAKGEFIGREALKRQKEEGRPKHLVGVTMPGRSIPRHGYPARLGADDVAAGTDGVAGTVTSGSWSPTLERAIGLVLLEAGEPFPKPKPGAPLEVEIRGQWVTGEVTALPFYRRSS